MAVSKELAEVKVDFARVEKNVKYLGDDIDLQLLAAICRCFRSGKSCIHESQENSLNMTST